MKQQQSEWILIFVHCWWLENSPYVIIVNTLLCGHCNIGGEGGQGSKVIKVHMSLASIQSSVVQNVMLFCKKRFMIFKINLVNLFLVVIFFLRWSFFKWLNSPTYPQLNTKFDFQLLCWTWTWAKKYNLCKFSSGDFWMVWMSIAWKEIPSYALMLLISWGFCFCKCLPLLCNNFLLVIVENQGGEQY